MASPAAPSAARGEARAADAKRPAKKGSVEGRPGPVELRAPERALLEALARRTRLSPPEVVARALQSYAAAVAPELRSAPSLAESTAAQERLFLSVDGRPELEVTASEFVLGSGPGCDLQLELPLIAPRHARILVREGRHLFEDLRSPKGSYRHGQLVDVRFLEDGDEIDLGGFLPIRFRVEKSNG